MGVEVGRGMELGGQVSLFDGARAFRVGKPIRLIEMFAGYGSQHFALEYLGAEVESWKVCEWAVKSIQAYKDAHFADDKKDYSQGISKEDIIQYLFDKHISMNYNEPMTYNQIKRLGEDRQRTIYNNIKATNNLVDIQQVKGKDLDIVDADKYCYVMTYSFPCFTADSLVLTSDGYKRIADMEFGDLVLSHDNKYHKVVNVFNNGAHDTYKINAMGIDEIKTTYNHKFYVREKYRKGHKAIRCFGEPVWKELKDLTKNDYLGIAINQNNTSIVSNKLPTQHNSFWWLIGRYLGDGWTRQQGGIIICCDKKDKELSEIAYHLDKLNWNYNIVNERTVYKIHIPKKALSEFVEQFGTSAGTKHLTKDILDLPIHYLEPFVKGYISADGCFTNGVYKATSISRELIYGIAQCVAKVYKTPYRIYKVEPSKTKIIEDRLVNQHNWYQLVFKTEKRKQDKAFYEDGYIWYPINSIEYIGKNNVYDIEVEESHSFTVQNTIVHNCQDLSSAGLGKGMEKGSGTRSGTLWEVERILDEIVAGDGELPQVLLMENVPEVKGAKNIKDFAAWVEKLESLGYYCKWAVLNAKDYVVPQNRERCFMVSILGKDYYYDFPAKVALEKRLKDLLEVQVDERYYLSDKMLLHFTDMKDRNGFVRGERFKPIDADKKDYGYAIKTTEGQRVTDNFIICKESGDTVPKILQENLNMPKCLGGIGEKKSNGGTQYYQQDRIYSADSVAMCHPANLPSGSYMYAINEPPICASRGRNPDNPSSRVAGEHTEQRLEINKSGCSNTLTTVQKDNYVIEPEPMKYVEKKLLETIKNNGREVSEATVINNYRIRKLTPKECFRLMGVKDQDFERIAQNQSNASLYHLAGDSIVTSVLMAIFGEMLGIDWRSKLWEIENKGGAI